MQTRTDYLLPEFGQVHEYQNESAAAFVFEALTLSYRVLMLAMKGFTALAIPIWVVIVLLIS